MAMEEMETGEAPEGAEGAEGAEGGDVGTMVQGVFEGLGMLSEMFGKQSPAAGEKLMQALQLFQEAVQEAAGGGEMAPRAQKVKQVPMGSPQGKPLGPQGM